MNAPGIQPPAGDGGPAMDIYHQFRGLIVSGQLGAGERLPTTDTLGPRCAAAFAAPARVPSLAQYCSSTRGAAATGRARSACNT